MSKIYHNPSNEASYSSAKRLYDYVKKDAKYDITLKEIEGFLRGEEVHTTHIESKKPKRFYSMQVPYNKYLTQIDSFFFEFEGEPKKRIILGIDAFSRKAAARAVTDLKSQSVDPAVREIINELEPQRIMFDKGREYNNSVVLSTLRDKNIKYIIANPPYKSSMVERLGRSVKNALYKAMSHRGDTEWSKYLPKVIEAYNNRKHRTIGMTPNEASKRANEAKVWFKVRNQQWKHMPKPQVYKLDIGDPCRIKLDEPPLAKAYYETHSTQVYFVSHRYSRNNIHRFRLKDANNIPIQDRSFTYAQLQLVQINSDTLYRIQKILGQKVIRGKLYSLVRWRGYDSNFDTYVANEDILTLQKK